MRYNPLWKTLGPAISICAAPFSYAEQYLTEDQARDVLFPGETFTDASIVLTEEQRKLIAKASGVRVRNENVNARKSTTGDWLFFDSVVGKHEYIDFALGLNADGSVKGVEIMNYRETYGKQVMVPEWRAQFTGKTVDSPIKIDEDIRNMSGATLSCYNVTQGVRRLIHTWNLFLKAP